MTQSKAKPLSFFRKQLFVIVGVNIFSLAVASGLLYSSFINDYQNNLVDIVHSKLVLLSSASSSSLLFDDEQAATHILNSLERDPMTRFAQIFDAKNNLFAEYIRAGQEVDMSIQQLPDTPFFFNDNMYLYEAIELEQQVLGYLLISTGTDSLQKQKRRYAYIVLVVFCFSLFLAYILNWQLQKRLTAPISKLVNLVRFVAKKRVYNKRLVSDSNDGFGDLFAGVNSMLDTIQTHEKQLQENSERLEGIVQLRTEELFIKANYDGLTKLPNRHLLMDRIDDSVLIANREKSQLSVMFLDLNRFKIINDNLGHGMGDKILVQVAKRLVGLVDKANSVARWGGDEFVILLEHIQNKEDAQRLAKKIVTELSYPIFIDGHQLHISASIGITLYPDDGENSATLLKHADMSMYKAKELGLGQFCFFNQKMLDSTVNYLAAENDMRRAIAHEEFFLEYQPQICANSQKIVGAEALIRWNNNGKVTSPADFLPVAEDLGLMTWIGLWVLQHACWQNKIWQVAGLAPIRVAINLSVSSIMDPQIVQHVANALESAQLDPKWLEIEITETNFISSTEYTIKVLRELQALGVHVSIDDFGTGYSCMSYLRDLPIDTLKIDGSFIQDLGQDKASDGIVQSIVTLGKSLNLQLVGECAETQQQVDMLRQMECDVIQGYFYSKPLSAEKMHEYLQKHGKLAPIKPSLATI